MENCGIAHCAMIKSRRYAPQHSFSICNYPFSIHKTTFPLHKMQEERWFFYGDPCCSAGRFAVPHCTAAQCSPAVPHPAERAARAVPAYARADHCRSTAGKDVHRPPRRHARQHCRAERHNRDAAVAEQSAAWRHRPHSAGADACTQLRKQAGTLCGERLRLSEHRPARSAPHTALSDVLIRIFRRF